MARPKKKGRDIDGIVLIDKPQGMSSNDVLQKVKRLYNANKAGHTGALDPLATGMLPICLGEATKFSQFLLDADKRYRVTAKLGERTDTSDAEGNIVASRAVQVSIEKILQTLPHFTGDLQQIPTMFSALKHKGKPLYEYARAGINVEREARPITIFSLDFIDYQASYLTLDVHCSKGTYIRTLVDDMGEYLGCGAHVVALRRTAVANYPYDKMLTLSDLQQQAEQSIELLTAHLLPVDSAVSNLPILQLDKEKSQAIQFGQRIKINESPLNGLVRLFSSSNHFLGIARVDEINTVHPVRLIQQKGE